MKNKKIFIIDDDVEITKLLSVALSRNGFDVKTAADYREALSFLGKTYTPEVIMMDYYLPEIDGATLSKMLFEKGVSVPIVFFTAADTEELKKVNLPNVVGLIKKPFSIDDVVESLNGIIRIGALHDVKKAASLEKAGRHQDLSRNIVDIIYTEKAVSLKLLLSKLSHSIKNSLQTVSNYVELWEKGYIEEADRDKVFTAIKRKIHEIKGELDILKRPDRCYADEKFSLKICLKKILEAHKKEIKNKEIYIKTEFQKKLPLYYGKKGLFQHCMDDMIAEAVECVPEKGRIEIALFIHQQEYVIEMFQSGLLISCENYLRFFDLSEGGRDGIKLTRAIMSLKELGGRIHVEGVPEGGIIFTISFPMRK